MIVVLDTTVFSADFTCSGTAWRVLAHAEKAWGLNIYVPEVVIVEAIGGYTREISYASTAVDKLSDKYSGRLGLTELIETTKQSLATLSQEYPVKVSRIIQDLDAEVLPPPEISHLELVKRATSRRKPCNQHGDGYRDTLNWLLVLQLASEHADESVYWVTVNTQDFADETKEEFHSELREDIESIGASGRVHLARDLSSLLLTLAESHYDESADDLRKVRDRLQQGALADFVSESVNPMATGMTLSPRRCGLPLTTTKAEVLALQGMKGIQVEIRGVAEKGGAFAQFSFTAETLIGIDLSSLEPELDEGLELADGIDYDATSLKNLSYGGLIQLDMYGRPVSGEISQISALREDHGLRQWRDRHSGLASLQAALSGIRRPLIDPKILEGFRPKIDPKIFELMMPKIDPKIFTMMQPKIDPKIFDVIRPKIDSSFLQGLLTPAIDPKIWHNLASPSARLPGLRSQNSPDELGPEVENEAADDEEDPHADDE